MKRKIGIALLIIGIAVMGAGIYLFFESYDSYLEEERNKKDNNIEDKNIEESGQDIEKVNTNIYDGDYTFDNEVISIRTISNEVIYASINNEGNEFTLNGNKFENRDVDLFIEFDNNCLTLSSDSDNTKKYCK